MPTSTPPFPFLKRCQELLNCISCEKVSDRAFSNVLVTSSDTAILERTTIVFSILAAEQILYWL